MTTPQLHILSTLALRGILKEVIPEYEKQAGCSFHYKFDATVALDRRIREGARADVAFLTDEALARLEAEGILAAGTRVDLVRSEVGMAVRQDAPSPSIGSVDEFVSTLLAADSVSMSEVGASGIYLKKLLKELGIADEIAPKARIVSVGLAGEPVARGEVQLAMQQISELSQVPGLKIIPLPAAIQLTTTFGAGVFAQSTHRDAAQALIAYLASAQFAATLRRHGFDPITG